MLPTIRIAANVALPDNDQWQFRFEVKSEKSDRVYIISQNKKHRFWACSCPGWKRHRKCKHLIALDLPCHEQPMEVNVQKA